MAGKAPESLFMKYLRERLQADARRTGVADLAPLHDPGFNHAKAASWAKEQDVTRIADLDARAAGTRLELTALRDLLGDAIDRDDGGTIREDLYPILVAYTLESKTAKELLDVFLGYISDAHYRMLQDAIAAANLRALGRDDQAKNLMASSEKRHGPDAAKINNLYSSGYLETVFWFQLSWCQAFNARNAATQFRAFFEQQLKFFDRAIFVGVDASPATIKDELRKRFLLAGGPTRQKPVSVWVAGRQNILTTKESIHDWLDAHPDFDYSYVHGRYGSAVAVMMTVFHKPSSPDQKTRRIEPYPEWLPK